MLAIANVPFYVLVNMMVDMPSIGESSRVSGSDAKSPLTIHHSPVLLNV